MQTFAPPNFNRVLHARFAGARAAAGVLKFPAFLLVWSFGVVLATGVYLPADALVRQAPIEFSDLQSLPSLDDDSAFRLALELQLRESTVVAGEWHPQVAAPATPATYEALEEPETEEVSQLLDVPVIQPQIHLQAPRMIKSPVVQAKPEAARAAEPAQTLPSTQNQHGAMKQVSTSRGARLAKRDARRALAAGEALTAYRSLMASLSDGARDSGYLGLLGVAALASGQTAEAHMVYERLLVMEPDNEQWWAGLAVSSERLGMEAASVYQEALARSEGDSKVQQLVRTRLQGLG